VSCSGPHNSRKKCTDWRWSKGRLEKLELGLFSLEKRRLKGAHHHTIPLVKGQLQRERTLSLRKQLHGEDKGQQVQVVLGEVSSQHKK